MEITEDKVTLIAQKVVMDSMEKCLKGHDNTVRIDNLEEDMKKIEETMTDGFKSVINTLKERDEKKQGRWWEVIMVVLQLVLAGWVATHIK